MHGVFIGKFVARKCRQARHHSGLSQRELADVLGVTTRTIAHWESGDRVPTLGWLLALVAACDLNAAWLFSELDDDFSRFHPAMGGE